MAKVQIELVDVLNNRTPFLTPFKMQITFVCTEALETDLEWKMIYVGRAEDEEHDQVLESVWVGPVSVGRHMFTFEAGPPVASIIPVNDALGVTALMLTCSYYGQEFIRIGYYIINDYEDPDLKNNPPSVIQFDKVVRRILATHPRVTRFTINWERPNGDGGSGGSSGMNTV